MSERYPMCEDQPAQIDCRREGCQFHDNGKCNNVSPAITLNSDGSFHCWSHRLGVKPCPFCGGEAKVINEQVQCPRCHIGTIHFGFESTAIMAWNKRKE